MAKRLFKPRDNQLRAADRKQGRGKGVAVLVGSAAVVGAVVYYGPSNIGWGQLHWPDVDWPDIAALWPDRQPESKPKVARGDKPVRASGADRSASGGVVPRPGAKTQSPPSEHDRVAQGNSRDDNRIPPGEASGNNGLQTDGRLSYSQPRDSDFAADSPSTVVTDWCASLAERVISIERSGCLDDGFIDTGHRSVEGRPIVVRRVDAASRPARGRILLLSATHGDEPSGVGTAFDWLSKMVAQGTPYRWNVVPVLNPDGALHDPATRVNAHGVDLNRNLPTNGWAKKSQAYWRRVGFEKRRFPGKSPGSEPENRWLVDEIRNYQPDVIITLHAPYGVLDYDGAFPPPRKLGQLRLHRLGVYPGSLGNFASRMRGIPVMTIELEDARKRPSQEELGRMWDDLNAWLDRYFRSVRQASSGNAAEDAG